MLDWDRLRIFAEVARCGSVGVAADILHMSSPAVSHQLRKLAAEVGQPIVEPQGRGIRLTEMGRRLADYSQDMSVLVQRAVNEAEQSQGELSGRIRVAAVATTIRGNVGLALAEFARQHPQVEISCIDGETPEHLQGLARGRFDVVVAESWGSTAADLPTGVHVSELDREPATIAVAATHPLAERRTVSMPALAGQRWVTNPPGSEMHDFLTQWARTSNLELDAPLHVSDQATLLSLVARGVAIALAPQREEALYEGVRFIRCSPAFERRILLVRRAGEPSLAVQRFIDTLHEH